MSTNDQVGERPGREPLTDAQKRDIAAESDADDAARPLAHWQLKMDVADVELMPRWAEDLAASVKALGGTVSQQTLDRVAAKQALRDAKPSEV